MSKLRTAAVAILVLAGSAAGAHAQGFGAQVSYGTDSELGVGARLEYSLANKLSSTGTLSKALLIGSFDYFFPGNDLTWWEINANVAVPIGTSSMRPYVGAGLNYTNVGIDIEGFDNTSSSDVGLNILGGIHIGTSSLKPFVEARLEAGGGSQFVITGGIMIGGKK